MAKVDLKPPSDIASPAGDGVLTTGPNAGKKIVLSKSWDRMGLLMDNYHAYFRQEYKHIYEMADKYEKRGMSLKQFLAHAKGFHQHLNFHHGIEEQHIFPILGKRMPEFAPGTGEHLQQHVQIHDGLDRYSAYINKCQSKASEYTPAGLREVMDSFEKVLFEHLDEEVVSLKGKNMSKYWTLEEIGRLPM